MARVLFSQTFSKKHVTQMTATARTLDFDTLAIKIRQSSHGSLNLLVECRPTTVSIEFGVGSVQLRVAPPTDIDTVLIKIVVLSSEWPFGAFSFDYVPLVRR